MELTNEEKIMIELTDAELCHLLNALLWFCRHRPDFPPSTKEQIEAI
jgi:hypothetical protein